MANFNTSFYPRPISTEQPYAYGCGMMVIRSIPIVGNIVSAVQGRLNSESERALYLKKEYAKCERLGALLLIIFGIVLLALSFRSTNFAIAGGATLGVGLLDLWYSHCKVCYYVDKCQVDHQGYFEGARQWLLLNGPWAVK